MEHAAAAGVKTTLQGVALPAEKTDLLEYAVRQRAEPALLDALQSLPARQFASLDEVADELVRVQPPRDEPVPHEPTEESGLPPGGDDYTDAHPSDTGRVRE